MPHAARHPDPFDLLLPRPKRITRMGGEIPHAALASQPPVYRETGLPAGGYTLTLEPDGATVTASDEAGAHHAKATLAQIRRLPHDSLPTATITDHPAIPTRGLMLDVSRCRVPRMDQLAQTIETIAGLKLNHLQCYTEHAFAYKAHEQIWTGTDPITPDEAHALAAHARHAGVELAANQNCFGHLTRWLTHPDYAHLAETHGDWTFAGMPRSGPFSLCPTDPRSIAFVEGLLNELLPCFTSSFVNIGCDETYDVGQGRSRDAVKSEGKSSVYGGFVGAVCRAALARGRTPMFWADIARDHPAVLDHIPQRAHALVWGYEPGHDFETEASLHRERGRPWWACPGTSSWRSFTGRSMERSTNIAEAAYAAITHSATGFLLTDWGDLGHRQVWPISLLAIAEGADAAWAGPQPATAPRGRFLDAASLHLFNDPSGRTAAWLDELGDADEPIRAIAGVPNPDGTPTRLLNASALFTDLHTPPLPLALPADTTPWADCRDRLADLAARVPTGSDPLIERELHHAAECAIWAADCSILRRGGPGDADELRSRLAAIIAEHADLWRTRSREGGLDESTAHWKSALSTLTQPAASHQNAEKHTETR